MQYYDDSEMSVSKKKKWRSKLLGENKKKFLIPRRIKCIATMVYQYSKK